MENSSIEWTHHTFNAWIGCSKVSPGCKFCYAESDFDKRKGRALWGIHGTRSVTAYDNWRKVLSWQRKAKVEGVRRRVFVNSLADTFEDFDRQLVDHMKRPMFYAPEDVDADGMPLFRHQSELDFTLGHRKDLYEPLTLDALRFELFRLIDKCPDLDFLLLTKRPENITRMWPDDGRIGALNWQRPNVWLGFSAEDQANMEERAWAMLQAKGLSKYIFASIEPQLGRIDLNLLVHSARYGETTFHQPWSPLYNSVPFTDGRLLDWVIVGGESGTHKRPWDPEWGRLLRDQCAAAGVQFFGKQHDKVQPLPPDLLVREFPDGSHLRP